MNVSLFFLYSFYLLLLGFMMFILGLAFNLYSYGLFLDYEFFSGNSVIFSMSIYLDDISLIFMGCVMIISSMVILYSYMYMSYDIYNVRFLYIVILFVISMMMLIISPNMFSIMLGWDGLGLISYCLVIYFNNYKSYNAGMLTVLTNRIGDVAILLVLSFMVDLGSFHFTYMEDLSGGYSCMLCFMVIVAAFTKSAQLPFSSWLPAAMAAPTPVSALVHSSTLVTAGVYLLIRFNLIFDDLSGSLFLALACLTMMMSGVGAIYEYDLKSIIALSTLSQLGLMMVMLFMGDWLCSFFHLINHAFFKSLLFLCAGIIIHCIGDSQDIRHINYSVSCLPVTYTCFLISSLSLCGIPYLTGFYSKHWAINNVFSSNYDFVMGVVFFISVFTTIVYSVRLIYYSLLPGLGSFLAVSCEENFIMILPMILLCSLSIVGGSALHWVFFFDYFNVSYIDLSFTLIMVILISFVFGIFLVKFDYFINLGGLLNYFIGSMWFMPSFSMRMLYYFNINCSVVSNNYFGAWVESFTLSNLIYFFKLLALIEGRMYMLTFNFVIMSMMIMFFMML
uniref:NADH dehydrogenase subunit 5 n=1 Tax=Brachyrhynchus triangulus TaxID=1452780 RepID=UPI001FF10105|nr:NADH dehydrogenase subunit 5 [Brachyrhynchus triangulus]UOG86757.1 NADH dehydrogenase subunit 5 [Brachyrhynchus triangulus]